MTKAKGVMDGDARVKRWYETWYAIIGFVVLTIAIFSAGIKFRDWQLSVYSVEDAEMAHVSLARQDSILSLRVNALEQRLEQSTNTISSTLDEFFCYLRRSQIESQERAWEVCVRETTRERINRIAQ